MALCTLYLVSQKCLPYLAWSISSSQVLTQFLLVSALPVQTSGIDHLAQPLHHGQHKAQEYQPSLAPTLTCQFLLVSTLPDQILNNGHSPSPWLALILKVLVIQPYHGLPQPHGLSLKFKSLNFLQKMVLFLTPVTLLSDVRFLQFQRLWLRYFLIFKLCFKNTLLKWL